MSRATTVLGLVLTLLGLTFTTSLSVGAKKKPRAAAVSPQPVSNETTLRRALAASSVIGTGSYACAFVLETPPIEIAPAPGKFEHSALAIKKKTPVRVTTNQGVQNETDFKFMFTAEPVFETIALRDQKVLKATFEAVRSDLQPVQIEIRVNDEGQLFYIDVAQSPSTTARQTTTSVEAIRCF